MNNSISEGSRTLSAWGRAAFRAVAVGVLGFATLGMSGCAPTQAMHYSGQIGRYCGEGISFSLPMVARAEKAGQEDKFWEVRTGIGAAQAVGISPPESSSDRCRENVTLSTVSLSNALIAADFRSQQLNELQAESGVSNIQSGEDSFAPWAQFSKDQDGNAMVCKAWFYVSPSANVQGEYVGAILLATSSRESFPSYDGQFTKIASTLRFDVPASGFYMLGQACDQVVASLAASSPAVAPAPHPAEPLKNSAPQGDKQ